MMRLLKLAWRGFFRFKSKRRHLTVILIAAFFFSVFFFSLFGSLLANQRTYWGDNLLGSGSIVSTDLKDYEVTSLPRKGSYFKAAKLKGLSEKTDFTLSFRLRIPVMARTGGPNEKITTQLFGIEPDSELKMTPGIYVTDGSYPESGQNEVALTYEMAGALGIDVGDNLTLFSRGVDGGVNRETVRLSGILGYNAENLYLPGVPNRPIYAPLTLVQRLRGVKTGTISEVTYRVENWWQRWNLSKGLPEGFKLTDFWGASPMLSSIHLTFSFFKWLILGVILVIVLASTYHNLKIMIGDRLKEIGIYLTFGADRNWVGLMWLGELTIYLLYCALWGTGLSLLAIWGINRLGIYSISSIFTVIIGGSDLVLEVAPRYFLLPFGMLWLMIMISSISSVYWEIDEEIASNLLENRGRE